MCWGHFHCSDTVLSTPVFMIESRLTDTKTQYTKIWVALCLSALSSFHLVGWPLKYHSYCTSYTPSRRLRNLAQRSCWCAEPGAQTVVCTRPWWDCEAHGGTAMWSLAPQQDHQWNENLIRLPAKCLFEFLFNPAVFVLASSNHVCVPSKQNKEESFMLLDTNSIICIDLFQSHRHFKGDYPSYPNISPTPLASCTDSRPEAPGRIFRRRKAPPSRWASMPSISEACHMETRHSTSQTWNTYIYILCIYIMYVYIYIYYNHMIIFDFEAQEKAPLVGLCMYKNAFLPCPRRPETLLFCMRLSYFEVWYVLIRAV